MPVNMEALAWAALNAAALFLRINLYEKMKMKDRKKKNAGAALAIAGAASLALCACGNLFSADSGGTETRVVISSEVTALLSEAGIQAESWTLQCRFASGNYMEETSASGAFSVQFPDSDIAAVFARPAISSPEGLGESAVPDIGAVYPHYGELEGSAFKTAARLELDFYGGVAARAAAYIFAGAESSSGAENTLRLAGAFNWSKLDNHLKAASSAVPYPLLVDMEKFIAAFFEGNTSMYWQIRSLETAAIEVPIPEEIRAGGGAKIVFPYYYPDHVLEIEGDGDEESGGGGLPEAMTLDLPDGQWLFLFPEGGKWLAAQAKDGAVTASYSSESL